MKAKDVILTAIYFKGTEQVKREAAELAEKSLCSVSYVKNIIRQVESGKILVNA
jgi:hypothetical protein